MNMQVGVPSFCSVPSNGLGEGAIVFVFDNDSKSVALDKNGEEVRMEDDWWNKEEEEEGSKYSDAYNAWISSVDSSSAGRDDYAKAQFPSSLASRNAAGLAIADGIVASLERDNGCQDGEIGDIDGDNSSPQKLRIINVSPLLCNFRNDLDFESKLKEMHFPSGVVDNKGVISGLVFSSDYEKYSCVKIKEGDIVVPFADTLTTNIDYTNQSNNSSVDGEQNDCGISGAIRGIKWIDSSNGDSENMESPYIEKGIICIPKNKGSVVSGVDTCNWNADGVSDRIGTVKFISFVDSAMNIVDGGINIPTANVPLGEAEESGNRAGVICGINVLHTNEGTGSAYITNGVINIKIVDVSGVDKCNWSSGGEDNPGIIEMFSFVDGNPRIINGQILIPTANSGDVCRVGGVSDIQETSGIDNPVIENGVIKYPKWEFDEEWFIVSGHDVSINTASLEAMASSIVDKIGVNVEVSGVVEYLADPSMNNAFVQFEASSTSYAESNSDLDDLGIDTNVATVRQTT